MKLLGDDKSLSVFLPRLMAPVAAVSSVEQYSSRCYVYPFFERLG